MIEHHEEAERLPAKPAQWTDVVALFETGALMRASDATMLPCAINSEPPRGIGDNRCRVKNCCSR
jgi:hypothetical protein